MDDFSVGLLKALNGHSMRVAAWCLLPNHYHALVSTENILNLVHELGRLHGRTSHQWNGEEETRGRKVFHRATERFMRSERHYLATVNYIHNNPVQHGYVELWTEWPWCSVAEFLKEVGREEAERLWRGYPILDYGKKWDRRDGG